MQCDMKKATYMTTDHQARAIADQVAGASYTELVEQCARAHRALEAWLAAHKAALSGMHASGAGKGAYTMKEAAAHLSCSLDQVRALLASGQLRRVPHLGRSVRIAQAEIDRFVAGGVSTYR